MTIDATPGLSEQVAEEIRALLGRRRMSQRELARRLKVSGPWVNYRLTGVQPIDLNDLQRIAAVFEIPVTDLLPGGVTSQLPNPFAGTGRPIDNRPGGRPAVTSGPGRATRTFPPMAA